MNNMYPRPQFLRQDWLSLEGAWSYSFSENKSPARVAWQGEICVPFPPESPMSGVHDFGYHAVVWYQRQFYIPETWQDKRILLHFGAVDYFTQVWVNDFLVAEHEGGHTPFSADITSVIVPGSQKVVVRAADEPHDLEKPRGKQDWELEPHAIWYPRTSGIWQPVWLEPVPTTSLTTFRLTPDIHDLAWEIEACLENQDQRTGLALDVEVRLKDQVLVSTSWPVDGDRFVQTLQLPAPTARDQRQAWLWSPEKPVLFDLTLTLREGNSILDQVQSYAGLRSVEAREGQFYLNGQPYFLQMVLDQGYWAESLLSAPSSDALRRDVELTKIMGFNGVRKHQKIEDPRYLYWADQLGLLVWGELPSAYKFSTAAARRLTQEFTAMIERDYNHPCVVAWVPFNESWGIPDIPNSKAQQHLAQTLYHLAKALDSTRLVIENDGWEHCCTDLFTIHDYDNRPEIFAYRYGTEEGIKEAINRESVGHRLCIEGFSPQGLPVVLSEFGGIRLGVGKGWGYQQAQSPQEFLDQFGPLMRSVYGKTITGYCYTQLTDTFQEQNGLLYADRKPKIDPEVVARILREGLVNRNTIQEQHLAGNLAQP